MSYQPEAYQPASYQPGAYQPGAYLPGPQQPYAIGYPPGSPPRPPLDKLALVAFVASLPGVLFVSIPLGIAGLIRSGRGWRRGRGLAIASLALSVVWVVVLAAIFAFRIGREPSRAADGTVKHEGATAWVNLRVGDCVKVPAIGAVGQPQAVGLLTVVPCSTPHNGQVFSILQASDGSYPGQTELTQQALQRCASLAPGYLGSSVSSLEVVAMVPNEREWNSGERSQRCVLVDGAQDITGDIRDH